MEHIEHASGRKKTACTSAVLELFGIGRDRYHYSEGPQTVKAILRRHGWSVRSRVSALGVRPNATTIGALRSLLRAKVGTGGRHFYVGVPGHAMVLNGLGETVVDTAPRLRDRRRVVHVSEVFRGC